MGNTQSMKKINFEDVQYVIKNPDNHLLINTLNEDECNLGITNTKNIQQEVELINKFLKNGNKNIKTVCFPRNIQTE